METHLEIQAGGALAPLLVHNCFKITLPIFPLIPFKIFNQGRYIVAEALFKWNQIKFLRKEINPLNVTSFHLIIPVLYTLKAVLPSVLCVTSFPYTGFLMSSVLANTDVSAAGLSICGLGFTVGKQLKKILFALLLHSNLFIFHTIQTCPILHMIACFWKSHWYLVIYSKFNVYCTKLSEKIKSHSFHA